MATYIFNGKVLPERACVTIGPVETATVVIPDIPLRFQAAITICASQILIAVNTDNSIKDLETLRNCVEAIVRNIVDAYGYIEGRGYDIEITSVIDSVGKEWMIFPVEIRQIHESKSDRPVTFFDLYRLLRHSGQRDDDSVAFKLNQLRRAFADLREAIRSPADTDLFCYRAIECIRQCYLDPDKEDNDSERKRSWERMSKELRISRSWIATLKNTSAVQRHGGLMGRTANERVEAMRRAWRVVDRFIMSAKDGFRPLPKSEEILA